MAKDLRDHELLIELHYLGSVQYFSHLLRHRKVWFETQENYSKQSYRNRCLILTAQGVKSLSIPVEHKGKQLAKDVTIDYRQGWVNDHWRTISSAYGKAPFYEHFAGEIQLLLHSKPKFLFDLNQKLLTLCLYLANLRLDFSLTETYQKEASEGIIDMRSKISPKEGCKNDAVFQPVSYHQVFGKKFVENLSLIDLLFCEGPNSGYVIQESTIYE